MIESLRFGLSRMFMRWGERVLIGRVGCSMIEHLRSYLSRVFMCWGINVLPNDPLKDVFLQMFAEKVERQVTPRSGEGAS